MEPPQTRELKIHLDDTVAQGLYSNLQIIQHTDTEFIVDFVFVQPGMPKARVSARIVMAPKHAKSLVQALAHHVRIYEERFGEIAAATSPTEFGSGGPQGSGSVN